MFIVICENCFDYFYSQQVTGDDNVPASKISVKILLGYPADAPPEGKSSVSDLSAVEPRSRKVPLDQLPEQRFSVPDGCHVDTRMQIPSRCIARLVTFLKSK